MNTPPTPVPHHLNDIELAEFYIQRLAKILQETHRIIYGQQQIVKQIVACILCQGHALLVGAPGLGKTKLVITLATILGLTAKRIQFTPDLMPGDIIGSEILDETEEGRRHFRFVPGPVFCQLLMADEINRASPRTQSALLQAMQEHYISVTGRDYPLPRPFHVLATQNPIEQDGTYPLPEAQLDRFMIQANLTYADEATEKAMILATTTMEEINPQPIFNDQLLSNAQALIRRLPIGERLVNQIVSLVRNARPETTTIPLIKRHVAWGPGPRAAQALLLLTRAKALLEGRLAPSQDDVVALLPAVLHHRIALNFSARAENIKLDDIISLLLEKNIQS